MANGVLEMKFFRSLKVEIVFLLEGLAMSFKYGGAILRQVAEQHGVLIN